jgi:hypothetical protein
MKEGICATKFAYTDRKINNRRYRFIEEEFVYIMKKLKLLAQKIITR